MSFPRIHVFEFEDQRWFPTIIRDLATDYLSFIQATFRVIGMYVNDFTRDYGEIGREAVRGFLGDGYRAGYIDKKIDVTFVD
jgi:hypothetical protein